MHGWEQSLHAFYKKGKGLFANELSPSDSPHCIVYLSSNVTARDLGKVEAEVSRSTIISIAYFLYDWTVWCSVHARCGLRRAVGSLRPPITVIGRISDRSVAAIVVNISSSRRLKVNNVIMLSAAAAFEQHGLKQRHECHGCIERKRLKQFDSSSLLCATFIQLYCSSLKQPVKVTR